MATKLETFLLKAIRTAQEEITEEIESWLEGADGATASKTIQDILADLVKTAENFDEFTVEEEITEEETDGYSYRYKVGERVRLQNTFYIYSNSDRKVQKALGYGPYTKFSGRDSVEKGAEAIILARGSYPGLPSVEVYAIKSDGKKLCVAKSAIEKV